MDILFELNFSDVHLEVSPWISSLSSVRRPYLESQRAVHLECHPLVCTDGGHQTQYVDRFFFAPAFDQYRQRFCILLRSLLVEFCFHGKSSPFIIIDF